MVNMVIFESYTCSNIFAAKYSSSSFYSSILFPFMYLNPYIINSEIDETV